MGQMLATFWLLNLFTSVLVITECSHFQIDGENETEVSWATKKYYEKSCTQFHCSLIILILT